MKFVMKAVILLLGFVVISQFLSAQEIKEIKKPVHLHQFHKVTISHSGLLAAAAINRYGNISIFETVKGNQVARIVTTGDADGEVVDLFFTKNDNHLLVAFNSQTGYNAKLVLYNIVTGEKLSTMSINEKIRNIAFDTTNGWLAYEYLGKIKLAKLEATILTETTISFDESYISQMAFFKGGKYIVTNDLKDIHVWDIENKQLKSTITVPDLSKFTVTKNCIVVFKRNPFSHQYFNADGMAVSDRHEFTKAYYAYGPTTALQDNLIVGSFNRIVIIDSSGYEQKQEQDTTFSRLEFNQQTGHLFRWNNYSITRQDLGSNTFSKILASSQFLVDVVPFEKLDKNLSIVDTFLLFKDGGKQYSLGEKYAAITAVNGNYIAIALFDGTVQVWDVDKEQLKYSIKHNHIPTAMQLDMDGKQLYLTDFIDSSLYQYNLQTKTGTVIKKENSPITALLLKDKLLAYGLMNGDIKTYSINNSNVTVVKEVNVFGNAISALSYINNKLIIASYGRMIAVKTDLIDIKDPSIFIGHNGYITAIAPSADGNYFASTANDAAVKLWDTQKSSLAKTYQLDSSYGTRLNMMADGELLITGGGLVAASIQDSLFLQQLKNPTVEIMIQSPNSNVGKIVINKEGTLLASTDQKTVKVRDLKSGFLISEFSTPTNIINGIVFSNDGKMIAVAAGEGIACYDPVTGAMLRFIDLKKTNKSIHDVDIYNNAIVGINKHGWHNPEYYHKNSGLYVNELYYNYSNDDFDKSLNEIKISADASKAATYGTKFIKVFNTLTGKQLFAVPRVVPDLIAKYWQNMLDFSDDGKYLIYTELTKPATIKILDANTGKLIKTHRGGLAKFGNGSQYVYMKSDMYLALTNVEKDTTDFKLLDDIEHTTMIKTIAFNSKANVFATGDFWGNIRLIEATYGTLLNEIKRFDQYTYTAIQSANNRFVVFNNLSGLFTYDFNNMRREALPGDNYPFSAVFAAASDKIYFRKGRGIYCKNIETGIIDSLFKTATRKDETKSHSLSADGKVIYYITDDDDVYGYEIATGKLLWNFNKTKIPGLASFVVTDVVMQNGTYQLEGGAMKGYEKEKELGISMAVLNPVTLTFSLVGKEMKLPLAGKNDWNEVRMRSDLKVYKFSPNKKYFVYIENFVLKLEDRATGKIVFTRDNPALNNIMNAEFDAAEHFIILALNDGTIETYDLYQQNETFTYGKDAAGLKRINVFKGGKTGTSSISLTNNMLLVHEANSAVSLYDMNRSFEKILDMVFIKERDQILIDKNGYYFSTKNSNNYLAFKKGTDLFPFERFDIIYNRPDKVLEALQQQKLVSPQLVAAYKSAYDKRLLKVNTKPDGNFALPIVTVNKKSLPSVSYASSITVPVNALASKAPLSSLQVVVNGVPLYGSKGMRLNKKEFTSSISLNLSEGANKIKVFVIDTSGVESYPETMSINYVPAKKTKPNLYIIAISVSDYLSDHDLKYAQKDGNDISKFLANNDRFEKVFIDTLFNKNATKENFLALKKKLSSSKEDDEVVVFASGHGLLDKNYEFYFATYDCDFEEPSKRGIAYHQIEWLLDSIPSRKKMLLIDACHSGEIDRSSIVLNDTSNLEKNVKATYLEKKKSTLKNSKLGLENSYVLMQQLFSNLNRGSGTVVIAAAAGNSYALESDQWNNGVFTYSILDGLTNKNADTDNDGHVSISELREYVYAKVQKETGGRQKPTTRQENVEHDFIVW